MRENSAMWEAVINTCHDLWTCKDLERDVKICLKQRVALISAQQAHQVAKSQLVSLQQSNELTIYGKAKKPRMVRKPCYLMCLPHHVSWHKKDTYIDEWLLLHTKDGSTSESAMDDYILSRQIDPPFNFEEDDEEEGVSKKKKNKAMKPPPLVKLLKVSPSWSTLVNPTRPISRARSLPKSTSGKHVG